VTPARSATLERLMRSWAELALSPAGAIPKIIISEAGNFPELARFYREEVVDRGMELMRRVLRLGVERGEFRAPDDFDNAVRCICAPILLAMLWRQSLGRHEEVDRFDPEAICRTQLKLVLDGLASRPAASVTTRSIDRRRPTRLDHIKTKESDEPRRR
jgi:hypothetical protein